MNDDHRRSPETARRILEPTASKLVERMTGYDSRGRVMWTNPSGEFVPHSDHVIDGGRFTYESVLAVVLDFGQACALIWSEQDRQAREVGEQRSADIGRDTMETINERHT